MAKLVALNRRTMDSVSARAFYYHSRVYELMGKLADIRRYVGVVQGLEVEG